MKKGLSLLFLLLIFFVALSFYSKYSGPSLADWHRLNESVNGRLIQIKSPLKEKVSAAFLKQLQDPFVIQEYPWGTQSTGWLNGWKTAASAYAVKAEKVEDIIAAVRFAKKHGLRLVVKGAGHDYWGRSSAANSLLVWTHHMRGVMVHDHFVPKGAHDQKGVPAVTVEAGARWIEVYEEVTTKNSRYAQGGGCTTVGAAGGFLQGGGFGSFSRKYGLAAGSLLEAEVVLASGEVVTANAYQHEDLFWALKGGGGGTFGIVAKATLETHELPTYFGRYQVSITAATDEAFKDLLEVFIHFCRENLLNEHWGEKIFIKPENTLDIELLFQGLNKKEAEKVWEPFNRWIAMRAGLYAFTSSVDIVPANKFWDYKYLEDHFQKSVKSFHLGKEGMFYWAHDQDEVLAYWFTLYSRWLPAALFANAAQTAQTLFNASRHAPFAIHLNKGLAGASQEAVERSKNTSINPVVLDSAGLAILGASQLSVFPGMPDHEPNIERGREKIGKIKKVAQIISDATPGSGSYSNEADYFQEDWQEAFWGHHYPRLLQIKQKYDPDNFFHCHYSVGSEK